MNFNIKELCPPSLIYFIISILTLLVIFIQNLENKTNYKVGSFFCRVQDTNFIFFMELLYILFWTWILNLICKDGHSGISWLLVLFPYLLFFVIIGLMMLNKNGFIQ